MRLIINILTVLLIGALIYLLVSSIKEPIDFKNEKDKRTGAVVDRLMKVRQAQEVYKSITGKFANNFDSLEYVLGNGQIPVYKVIGDPDDPNNVDLISVETLYFEAKDSIEKLGINLDSLRFVPYGTDNLEFTINADTMTYQKTLVNVCEVGVIRRDFMGAFGSEKFRQYDQSYQPNSMIKFGDLDRPNLSGNWER
jgi:hypothetical protein